MVVNLKLPKLSIMVCRPDKGTLQGVTPNRPPVYADYSFRNDTQVVPYADGAVDICQFSLFIKKRDCKLIC